MFFLVDAGYFMNKKIMQNYINWPSTKKCLEDDRLLLGQVRRFSNEEIKGIINFDKKYHEKLKKKEKCYCWYIWRRNKKYFEIY